MEEITAEWFWDNHRIEIQHKLDGTMFVKKMIQKPYPAWRYLSTTGKWSRWANNTKYFKHRQDAIFAAIEMVEQ